MSIDISAQSVDRARLYFLIDALEADLRDMISTWVLPFKSESDALGSRFDVTMDRATADANYVAGSARLIDYLDFHDAVAVLNRHSSMLPGEVGDLLRRTTPRLDQFVAVRNRVMHGRPLQVDDLELGVRLCTTLTDGAVTWPKLEAVVQRLATDPQWVPAYPSQPQHRDRILHNLPLAEFDETGLLGRAQENEDLHGALTRQRHPVITVVGEGGIGKTALAVKSCYDLIDDPACPYEALIWISLKEEVLTARGVEQLASTARDLTGISWAVGRSLDESFDGKVEDLADVLEGVRVLIVIDNLETADASEVIAFYEKLPRDTSLLATSRVGLGELERRMPVGPLDPAAATLMLRKLAQRRAVAQLSRLSQERLRDYAERLRHNPLAIRWFVEAVEAGAEPREVLADQGELLGFCMARIQDSLSSRARRLMETLFAAEAAIAASELGVLAGLPGDDLRRALHELQKRSLLTVQPSADGDHPTFALAATARDYLRTLERPSETVVEEVEGRLYELRRSEERRRRDEARNALGPNSVAIVSDDDRAVAHLLRQALQISRRGKIAEAGVLVEQARQLAPEYFEVPRVRAFIESPQHPREATELYRQAYELAPEQFKPKVAYFFSSHLAHAIHDPERALQFAEEAHEKLAVPSTALRLGQIRMYLEDFDSAEELLSEAIGGEADEKTSRIANTVLLDLEKRRLEAAIEAQRPRDAIRNAMVRLRVAWALDAGGRSDFKFQAAALELAAEIVRAACKMTDLEDIISELDELVDGVQSRRSEMARSEKWSYWHRWSQRLVEREDCPRHVAETIREINATGERETPADEPGRLYGRVESFSRRRGFGFLRTSAGEKLFFPGIAVRSELDQLLLTPGNAVSFTMGENDQGPCAVDVSVAAAESDRAESLRERRVEVKRKEEQYAFGDDAKTEVGVRLHPKAFRDLREWRQVDVGTTVVCDVEFGNGRPRAVTRSARIVRRHERSTASAPT